VQFAREAADRILFVEGRIIEAGGVDGQSAQ
jgi:hypothetical protein